jgi:hypothetical protein
MPIILASFSEAADLFCQVTYVTETDSSFTWEEIYGWFEKIPCSFPQPAVALEHFATVVKPQVAEQCEKIDIKPNWTTYHIHVDLDTNTVHTHVH